MLDHNFIAGNVFCLPVATALVDIALQQQPFDTAASQGEVAGGPNPIDQRLSTLEKNVSLIAESLKKLTEAPPALTVPKRPSALKATAKPTGLPCPPPGFSSRRQQWARSRRAQGSSRSRNPRSAFSSDGSSCSKRTTQDDRRPCQQDIGKFPCCPRARKRRMQIQRKKAVVQQQMPLW